MRRGADQRAGGAARSANGRSTTSRAGVVVLDDDDMPVLVNPAARAWRCCAPAPNAGTVIAHP